VRGNAGRDKNGTGVKKHLRENVTFHYSSVCRQPKCSVKRCGRRHHTMLHGDGDRTTEGQRKTTLSGFVSS